MMPFKRIDDTIKIKAILDAYTRNPTEQEPNFIACIHLRRGVVWKGHEHKGGLQVEGARPLSSSTSGEKTTYTLTNSDSNYTQPIGTVDLSDIVLIEQLR